jgi:hypothetical protein
MFCPRFCISPLLLLLLLVMPPRPVFVNISHFSWMFATTPARPSLAFFGRRRGVSAALNWYQNYNCEPISTAMNWYPIIIPWFTVFHRNPKSYRCWISHLSTKKRNRKPDWRVTNRAANSHDKESDLDMYPCMLFFLNIRNSWDPRIVCAIVWPGNFIHDRNTSLIFAAIWLTPCCAAIYQWDLFEICWSLHLYHSLPWVPRHFLAGHPASVSSNIKCGLCVGVLSVSK